MSEKAKKKGKKRSKKINKKTIIFGSSFIFLAISGLFIGLYFLLKEEPRYTFIYGYNYSEVPYPDPLNSGISYTDRLSRKILWQITECLFVNIKNGSTYEVVPHLAESYEWSDDWLNLTCALRNGITFHDGTPFDATSVKWNIDRLHRLSVPVDSAIINRTEIIDSHTVKFVLNHPFSPLLALLAHQTGAMLRPNSTIENTFIYPASELLCGTGPFKFVSYSKNESLTLVPYEDYWNTPNTSFDKIIFKLGNCTKEYNDLMISKNFSVMGDFPYSWYDDINLINSTLDMTVRKFSRPISTTIDMNTLYLKNASMRKAISYSVNYSDYFDHKYGDPMKSPVHEQIEYSTIDLDIPYYNITKARQTLLDANWPGTAGLIADDNISAGNPWETIAKSVTPLARYNFSYVSGWDIMEEFNLLVQRDLMQIGVNITEEPMAYIEWIYRREGSHGYNKTLSMFYGGWSMDYNHINNLLDTYTPESNYNYINLNDSVLTDWINEAFEEHNHNLRQVLYHNVQKRLVEEIYPSIWIAWDAWYIPYLSNITNLPNPSNFAFSLKNTHFIS